MKKLRLLLALLVSLFAMTNVCFSQEAVKINNPINSVFDIEYIGCYGKSADQTVTLVFTVMNKGTNLDAAAFGKSCAVPKSMAYDTKGNSYENVGTCSGGEAPAPYDVVLKKKVIIKKVLPTVKSFKLISLQCHYRGLNGDKQVEFRNVPIQWDVEE